MRTARTNKLRSAGVALALAAVAGLLAACGSGSASPGPTSLDYDDHQCTRHGLLIRRVGPSRDATGATGLRIVHALPWRTKLS